MADTRRQKLVNAIQAQLETITTANSYEVEPTGVFQWRDLTDDVLKESELPVIEFRDTVDTANSRSFNDYDRNLRVEVQGAVVATPIPEQTRKLIAAVTKAMMADRTFTVDGDRLATQVQVAEDRMGTEKKEKLIGFCMIAFNITYRVRQDDPFTG